MATQQLRKLLLQGAKRKLLVIASLVMTTGLCSYALNYNYGPFVNLKVLPKNISSGELSRIMVDDFTDGLGVSCSSCHATNKETGRLDYASDANPQKEAAREMMRMTMRINKGFFKVKRPQIGDSLLVIKCVSCHHGTAFPSE